MTWEEHFKEDAGKLPQEFLGKEITIEDCLKIIDGMAFTIKELFDKTKWHTGKPTEEGWYLIKMKCGDEIVYTTNLWKKILKDYEWFYAMRLGEIIGWRKIEK